MMKQGIVKQMKFNFTDEHQVSDFEQKIKNESCQNKDIESN